MSKYKSSYFRFSLFWGRLILIQKITICKLQKIVNACGIILFYFVILLLHGRYKCNLFPVFNHFHLRPINLLILSKTHCILISCWINYKMIRICCMHAIQFLKYQCKNSLTRFYWKRLKTRNSSYLHLHFINLRLKLLLFSLRKSLDIIFVDCLGKLEYRYAYPYLSNSLPVITSYIPIKRNFKCKTPLYYCWLYQEQVMK